MPNFDKIAADLAGPGRAAPTPADRAVAAAEARLGMTPLDRNDGRLAIDHQDFYASIFNAGIGTYYTRFDEALRASYEDAIAMRNDASIFELLRHRMYPVLTVNHYLRPDNPKDKGQQALCTELMRILDASYAIEDLRLANLEAIFWGKAGAQFATGRTMVGGSKRVVVVDHEPIHGDKIVHRFDGTPGVMIHTMAQAKVEARGGRTFRSDRALCLALDTPYWRNRFTLHRHEPADAEYLFEADKAGAKFGLGLRDRIYWVWWLRQEALGWCMNALKRIGANGSWLGYYPQGNAEAKTEVLDALKTVCEHNVAAFPRAPGGEPGAWFQQLPPTAVAYGVMMQVIEYFDGIIRRAIVGQEMTGEAASTGMNSNQADVHADVLKGINAYDARKLAGCLTRDLIPVLIRENFGAIPFGVRLVFEPEQDEFQARVASAQSLVNLGATLDLTDLVEDAGFKMAKVGTAGATILPPTPGGDQPDGPKPPVGPRSPAEPPALKRNAALTAPERYDARRSAVVVALIPPTVADRIAISGQEDPAEFHITLSYLGRDIDPARAADLAAAIRPVAAAAGPLDGSLGGLGRFPASPSSDGQEVLWKPVDVPGLAELRHKLVTRLAEAGFPASDEHGWTPHVTLAYVDPGDSIRTPTSPTVPLTIAALGLWIGDDHTTIPLGQEDDLTLERYYRKGMKRAPAGKATVIGGRSFKPGEWIPADVVATASAEEHRQFARPARPRATAPAMAPETASVPPATTPDADPFDPSAAKVDRAAAQLDGLGDAADPARHVDRIARGVTRDELFQAVDRAGIAHTATTKAQLVAHLKAHAGNSAPPEAAPPPEPASEPTPAAPLGLPAHLHAPAARLYEAETTDFAGGRAAVDSIRHLPQRDIHQIAHEFLGGAVTRSMSKTKLLDAISTRIHRLHRDADRAADILGTPVQTAANRDPRLKPPAEQAIIAAHLGPAVVPRVPRVARVPSDPTPVARPRAERPVVGPLPDHLHPHATRLYAAEAGDFEHTQAAIASIAHLPARDVLALAHDYLGPHVPASTPRTKLLAALRKHMADFQASRDRVDGILGDAGARRNRDPRLHVTGETIVRHSVVDDDLTLERYGRKGMKRAPAGGVTIAGVFYKGGEWIPADVVASATPAERKQMEKATPAGEKAASRIDPTPAPDAQTAPAMKAPGKARRQAGPALPRPAKVAVSPYARQIDEHLASARTEIAAALAKQAKFNKGGASGHTPHLIPSGPIADRLARYAAGSVKVDHVLAASDLYFEEIERLQSEQENIVKRTDQARAILVAQGPSHPGAAQNSAEVARVAAVRDFITHHESLLAANAASLLESTDALWHHVRSILAVGSPVEVHLHGGNDAPAPPGAPRRTMLNGLVVPGSKATVDRASLVGNEVSSLLHAGDKSSLQARVVEPAEDQDQRDFYLHGFGIIALRPEAPDRVIAHELGHAIDDQLGTGPRCVEFRRYRVGDEPEVTMREATGNMGYDPDETGCKDHFDRALPYAAAYYAGKDYGDGESSEILSSGIEALFKDPVFFADTDPEYFQFVCGILDGSLR